MESGKNQNVKVIIPPRPGKKGTAAAEPVQDSTQPVRVSIPPRHGRAAVMPQQEAAARENVCSCIGSGSDPDSPAGAAES